jgi:hypothetical protein
VRIREYAYLTLNRTTQCLKEGRVVLDRKDLEKILNQRAGKGMIIGGRVGHKEIVNFEEQSNPNPDIGNELL